MESHRRLASRHNVDGVEKSLKQLSKSRRRVQKGGKCRRWPHQRRKMQQIAHDCLCGARETVAWTLQESPPNRTAELLCVMRVPLQAGYLSEL
jgi:hypothetical protein